MTKTHTEWLFHRVRRIREFTFGLTQRLGASGIASSDRELVALVANLHDAAYDLSNELHHRLLEKAGYLPLPEKRPRRLRERRP